MTEPKVNVGILSGPQIEFILHAPFHVNGKEALGKQVVTSYGDKIRWLGSTYDELYFEPVDASQSEFEVLDVTIGINFHWERKENQRFQGSFKIITEDHKLTGINVIGVEDYLTSVISSEMNAAASLELLKAHAVISRSWLLVNMRSPDSLDILSPALSKGEGKREVEEDDSQSIPSPSPLEKAGLRLKWYDREDHTHFDVCADDHCQRYQGITRASTEIVAQAIEATRGQILSYDGKICDARFSKCCGGVFEEFQNCWENVRHPYLKAQRDSKTTTGLPDLTNEAIAEKWIRTSPEALCNTDEKGILSQVLNNYDQETIHFYRWKVEYEQKELSRLILSRSGIDFGDIIDLIPVKRGTSGRLVELKIVGSKRTLTIGKELEIRRTLSTSHLYSSAFVVDKRLCNRGEDTIFTLTGAGWGHGVGLCQIGAAVMGEKGYKYDEILLHYYIDAIIEKLY